MNYWLFKTEPDTYGIDDLARDGTGGWDGVRNYQARNRLRDDIAVDDRVIIQHSGKAPAAVGLARVSRAGHPDPTQFDPAHSGHDPKSDRETPRWYQVELRFERRFDRPVPLREMRGHPALAGSEPVHRARLSVQSLTHAEFEAILALAGECR